MSGPRTVLQKLLTGGLGRAIVEDGYDQVGGVVLAASDAAPLNTPDLLLAAYGFPTGLDFVDVVRFEAPPVAVLTTAASNTERPWPTYPTGFLQANAVVPVWELGRTRYSYGAEYWRIRSDGEQRLLSAYQGVARGWRGAKGWRPPSPMVGMRARWRDVDVAADLVDDSVLLTTFSDQGPQGWEGIRPGAWSAAVPREECELFEVVMSATCHGVPVRILASGPERARVLLIEADPEQAARIGADLVEPEVFEAHVTRADLENLRAVTNEVTPAAPWRETR